MVIKLLHYIFRIVWGASIIAEFFLMPMQWAIFALLTTIVISPLVGSFLYLPFRSKLFNYPFRRDIVSGALECLASLIVYWALSLFIMPDKNFVLGIVILYASNQLSRAYRNPIEEKANIAELWEFMGFFLLLSIIGIIYLVIRKV